MRSSLLSLVLVALYLLVAREAFAHPAPFSYLDLHLDAGGVSGNPRVHQHFGLV